MSENPRASIELLQQRMASSIKGQDELIRHIIIALLANGHVLLESLPGLAKTRTVKTLAACLDATMRRIQFTPDLLPADITGSDILYQTGGKYEFRFQPGPVMGNLILADEINRAPAKVQSALLEAMEERQVSVGGAVHPLPELFMVLATQNPIEQEGTYPLPEAQIDRFLFKLLIDYPEPASEIEVLRLVRGEELGTSGAGAGKNKGDVLPQEAVFDARREVNAIYVAPAIETYIVDILNGTRHPGKHDDALARWIGVGASPRGGLALDRAARVQAWLDGRDHVTPDDVRAVVRPALRHRLILSYEALADGVDADQVVGKLIEAIAVPA